MFDDDATEYDPNPWGSRQRLLPLASFIPSPAPIIASSVPPAISYAATIAYAAPLAPATPIACAAPFAHAKRPDPFITMRVPALPLHPRSRARFAIPMFGFAAVLLLALAYALKPTTIPAMQASISTPAMVEPLAMSASGVVAETAPTEPAVVAKPAPRTAQKPRAIAKRRPIKIDASITSSPLGQLRPSRR